MWMSLDTITHLNTVADQLQTLIATAFLAGSGNQCRTMCHATPRKLLRNGPRKELKASTWSPNSPDPNWIEHPKDVLYQIWSANGHLQRSCINASTGQSQVWSLKAPMWIRLASGASTLWTCCHVPRTAPLAVHAWNVTRHIEGLCHQGVPLLRGRCTWFAIMFGWVVCVGSRPHECQGPSRTLHCNKMINNIHFTCQWF